MATRTPKPAKTPQMDTTLASTFAAGRAIPLKAVEPEAKKTKKQKMVRDSFTIPKAEFQVIDVLKARCAALGLSIKKSELLRAGIKLLHDLEDAALHKAASNVPTIKTGRPSKAEAGETPAAKPVKAKTEKTPNAPEGATPKPVVRRAKAPAPVKATTAKATSVPKTVAVKKPTKTATAEVKPAATQSRSTRPAAKVTRSPTAEVPTAEAPQTVPATATPAA